MKHPPVPYPKRLLPRQQWLQQMQAQHAEMQAQQAADPARRDQEAQQVVQALHAQPAADADADAALIPHQDLRVQSTAMFDAMLASQQDYALARARERASFMNYVFQEPMWDLRDCRPRPRSCPPLFHQNTVRKFRFVDV